MNVELTNAELTAIAHKVAAILADKLQVKRDDEPLCLTEAQASALLGLKKHQLRDLRLAEKIKPARKLGRGWVYTRRALEQFLTETPN